MRRLISRWVGLIAVFVLMIFGVVGIVRAGLDCGPITCSDGSQGQLCLSCGGCFTSGLNCNAWCNVSSTCPDSGGSTQTIVNCDASQCAAPTAPPGGCNATCTTNAQCSSGLTCQAGKCDGASCNAGGGCASGWCTSGAECTAAGGSGSASSYCGGLLCCDVGGCNADCGQYECGQGDGCGGRCSTADNYDHNCSGLVLTNGQPDATRSYASINPCAQPAATYKACFSKLTMTFFDATLSTDCSLAGIAAAPKISGVEVSMRSNRFNLGRVNSPDLFTGTTDAAGQIVFDKDGVFPSADDPRPTETYIASFNADASQYVVANPRVICDQGQTRVNDGSLGDSQFSFALSRDNNVHTNNPTNRVEVGLVKQFGTWFQVAGGNVFGRNGIRNEIPSTCVDAANVAGCNSIPVGGKGTKKSPYQYATPLNFGERNKKGQVIRTGIVGVANGAIDLGNALNAAVSVLGDNATSGYEGARYDYSYFLSKMARLPKVDWNGTALPVDSDNFLYQSSGNITVPFNHVGEYKLNGQGVVSPNGDPVLVVILHDGDITINQNMIIPQGSYLGIIASGKISFAPNVTAADGVYVADVIEIASTGNTATDQQFSGNGSFVGWNGVLINRDLGNRNNGMPTAIFGFRADFPINAPDVLRSPQVSWREVAP